MLFVTANNWRVLRSFTVWNNYSHHQKKESSDLRHITDAYQACAIFYSVFKFGHADQMRLQRRFGVFESALETLIHWRSVTAIWLIQDDLIEVILFEAKP